jgi:aspartate racemase
LVFTVHVMSTASPILGVIGGMGPHAGLDLVRNILNQTRARADQAHLPVALLSLPDRIVDRSRFLFNETRENPARAIAAIARQLDALGATVAGLPCNTAHAPAIFDAVEADLARTGNAIRLIHMIEATVEHVRATQANVQRVGVLSTTATLELGLYERPLTEAGFTFVAPDGSTQERVNATIYDPSFGLKGQSDPPTDQAQRHLLDAMRHLTARGAEALILGCTELPLAPLQALVADVPLIDPARVLARALIHATYPDKLLPDGAAVPTAM